MLDAFFIAINEWIAAVRKLMENSAWQGAGSWFRRGAGVMTALLGGYFIVSPLMGS